MKKNTKITKSKTTELKALNTKCYTEVITDRDLFLVEHKSTLISKRKYDSIERNLRRASALVGLLAYNPNYKPNNGIRSFQEVAACLLMLMQDGNKVRSQYFCNKKPSYFGIDDCENERANIADAITFDSNGDRWILEDLGGIHNTIGTKLSNLAMAKKEMASLAEKAFNHDADHCVMILDKSLSGSIEYLQKEADRLHKDFTLYILPVDMNKLIYSYFSTSKTNIEDIVVKLANLYTDLFSKCLSNDDKVITPEMVKDMLYVVLCNVWKFDLNTRFINHGKKSTTFGQLAKETKISPAMLHLFFEEQAQARINYNREVARNKAYISYEANYTKAAARKGKPGKLVH